jgi:hypothetical protein
MDTSDTEISFDRVRFIPILNDLDYDNDGLDTQVVAITGFQFDAKSCNGEVLTCGQYRP